jgi:hypothetical protein
VDSIDRSNSHGCELDESEEGGPELVVASGDAAELLELVEEAFDLVALAVDGLLPAEFLLTVGAVGNVGNGTLSPDMRANAIRNRASRSLDDQRASSRIACCRWARFGTASQQPVLKEGERAEQCRTSREVSRKS